MMVSRVWPLDQNGAAGNDVPTPCPPCTKPVPGSRRAREKRGGIRYLRSPTINREPGTGYPVPSKRMVGFVFP